MAIEYANSDPIKVTHTKGAMSDGQKYTNTLPWKVELTNDDLAYQEDIQNLQRQINALEADLTWRDPVETYEDLPASGNDDGDVRLVTSTGVLYVWAGSEWVALNDTQDPIKELTEADYESGQNYVALWKLGTGFYHASNGIRTKRYSSADITSATALFTIVQLGATGSLVITYDWANFGAAGYPASYAFVSSNGSLHNNDTSAGYFLSSRHIVDDLTSTGTNLALSAKQGKVLNEKIGDLTTLETTDKTSTVNAINELVAAVIAADVAPSSADWNALFGQTIENVNGVGL